MDTSPEPASQVVALIEARRFVHILGRHVAGGKNWTGIHHRAQYRPSIKGIDFPTLHRRNPSGSRSAFSGYIGENFIFIQDNARPHTAAIIRQYLKEIEVPVMAWPARSPDLNPIEHLWDELKKRVRSRNTVPRSLGEIKTAINEEWDRIPQDFIKKLISSMKRRMQAVIQARGGNTSY